MHVVTHRVWIVRTLAAVVVLIVAVGLFNLLVDPYDLYRLVKVPGINANKAAATHQERLAKPLQVRFFKPHGLALGSSRVAVGIDPQHPGWDPLAAPVFNYALTSATIAELAARLEEAARVTSLRQVVAGLDFFMFNAYNPETGWRESEQASLSWPVATLLTSPALVDSWETLRKQDAKTNPGVLANGQVGRTFNLRRVARYGHRKGFENYERMFFEGSLFPPPAREYGFADKATGKRSFDSFQKLLEVTRQKNIDLHLFISPVHARMLEVYRQANLWEIFEEWKRQLVAAVEAHNARYPGGKPVQLWDFSGINSITTEPVPPAGDRQAAMRWYWEASHYKAETGDLILDRIFACRRDGSMLPDDFGVMLTRDNLEPHLVENRAAQAQWRRQNPQDVAEIEANGRESAWRGEKYRLVSR